MWCGRVNVTIYVYYLDEEGERREYEYTSNAHEGALEFAKCNLIGDSMLYLPGNDECIPMHRVLRVV